MGGGNCMFFILLPGIKNREEKTGFLLQERGYIIDHMARLVQRDQAGGALYDITEHEIIYYRK